MDAYTIKIVHLAASDPELCSEYKLLTLPSAHPFYQIPDLKKNLIGTEAWIADKLVGFCLAEIYPAQNTAQIYSLYVLPECRSRGIGQGLFHAMQDHLVKTEKISGIGLEYDKGLEDAKALEKILASSGWPAPYFYLLRCYINPQTFNPPWLNMAYRLPKETEMFTWYKLKEKEKSYIQNTANLRWFLPYISPFLHTDRIDNRFSVGLRYQRRVIGWCITHLIEPDLICYKSLYIEKSYQRKSWGIFLLIESIRRLKKSSISQALFEIKVREIDPTWTHFIKKRLLPSAFKVERKNWANCYFPSNS